MQSRDTHCSLRSQMFDTDTLEPNGILAAKLETDDTTWLRIAFALGMQAKDDVHIDAEVSRLCQRIRKRKTLSDQQTVEAFTALLKPMIAPMGFIQSCFAEYKDDAVPTRDTLKNSIHRLPVPKPAISIGFGPQHFTHLDDDLQNGIISTPLGDPADLGHLSQPVPGQYWPFFTILASEESLVTAQQFASVAGATCNNATHLLASALSLPHNRKWLTGVTRDQNFSISFSLGVSNKTAALNLHELDGGVLFHTTTLRTFRLDDEQDIAILASRLKSIMIWAKFVRLPQLLDKLESLDRMVNGTAASSTSRPYSDDFDPAIFRILDLRTKKSGRIRTAIGSKASKMPVFLRTNAAIAG